MFKWTYNNGFSFSIISESGDQVPYSDWVSHQTEYLSQITIIQELIDNGSAIPLLSAVSVEVEDVLRLDDIDKILLGLPSAYPFVIFVEPNGLLHQGSFTFKYSFFDFVPNGNRLLFYHDGVILKNDATEYLLSLNQFKILEAIDHFNSLPVAERTFHNNLTCFADIKSLSDEVAILLDSFLQSQNVLHPEKIVIDVSFQNNELEITPVIDTLVPESLIRAIDLSPTAKGIYNVANTKGGTTRVVLNDAQILEIGSIKRNRKITDKKLIEDIVENPENYFDDSIIDLAFYSQRVREIGVYKPKFYPFVCPYKSEWIPGLIDKG
jgi:hypothetical protein